MCLSTIHKNIAPTNINDFNLSTKKLINEAHENYFDFEPKNVLFG